jgi:hypothetical protein
MRNGAGGPHESAINGEVARLLLSDAHVQLELIQVQLLVARSGSEAAEGAVREIGSAKRAIEIARTHIAVARARIDAALSDERVLVAEPERLPAARSAAVVS